MNEKVFVSYKYTDVPQETLEDEMWKFCSYVESSWREAFCSLYRQDKLKEQWIEWEAIYDYFNARIEDHDVMLFFLNHRAPSRGMIEYELNKAKSIGKPMIMAAQKELLELEDFVILKEHSEQILVFQELEELKETLPVFLNQYFINKKQLNG